MHIYSTCRRIKLFKNFPQHISVVKNNFLVGGIKGNLNGSWHMLWLVTKREEREMTWLKELPGTKKPNPCQSTRQIKNIMNYLTD